MTPDDAEVDDALQTFFGSIRHLKQKLGVILAQLPPSMRQDLVRIETLAKKVARLERVYGQSFPLAIEFRHASWFEPSVFDLLNKYNIANVIIDSPDRWPASMVSTGDTLYLRFHGSQRLYRSSYTDEELAAWSAFVREHKSTATRVFAYFNNDHDAVAVANARTFVELLAKIL